MTTEQQKAESLRRFLAAVRDGRRGDYVKAQTIVHNVRQTSGDKVAEVAKKELWAYIRSEKAA